MNKDSFLKLLAAYGILFIGDSSLNAIRLSDTTDEYSNDTIDTHKIAKNMGWNAGCNSCAG